MKLTQKTSTALESLHRAIELNPEEKKFLCDRAQIYVDLQELPNAVSDYTRALQIEPTCPETHIALANVYDTMGNIELALSECFHAFYLKPQQPVSSYFLLGELFIKLNRPKSAIHAFENALALEPNNIYTLINLGAIYYNMGLTDKSIEIFRKTLSFDPQCGVAYYNLANSLTKIASFKEADLAYEKAFELLPEIKALVYNSRAFHKDNQNDVIGALEDVNQALKLDPNLYMARINRATFLLKMGKYREGWRDFEARYKKFMWKPLINQPIWKQENLRGRRLLICCDEGYGDAFQMARYLPLFKQKGTTIILAGAASLITFFKTLPQLGVSEWAIDTDSLPKFDYWLSVISIPHLFQTELDTIPSLKPAWQFTPSGTQRLSRSNNNFRVGLVWAGNPKHINNENRSISLSHFEPLFSHTHISFYSLQCGAPSQDIQKLGFENRLVNLEAQITNWIDTAEFLLELDLLITADTAIAHLSASLGKPTWIMLPFSPDYRWLLDRSDSPWYPSVRLFRQKTPHDWQSVIAAIKLAMDEQFGPPHLIKEASYQEASRTGLTEEIAE